MSSSEMPMRSMVIWHGHSLTPISWANSSNSCTEATLLSLARPFIILGPMPAKWSLDRPSLFGLPGWNTESIFWRQSSPVIPESLRFRMLSPQNVKKIVTSMP